MKITWLGHSCTYIEGSKKVLIDPFTGGLPLPTGADLVAVTHGHADHMGDAAGLGIPVIAINEIAKYLASRGVQAVGMNIGGTVTEMGVSFTMTQAVHSAWLEEAGCGFAGGGAAGYVIGMDGVRIYHSGDTALFSDMKLVNQIYHPHIALIPIGGKFTMGPGEAMVAAQYIGAPWVIPIHYDTWDPIRQDAAEFKAAVERTTRMKVLALRPGGSVQVSPGENGTIMVETE